MRDTRDTGRFRRLTVFLKKESLNVDHVEIVSKIFNVEFPRLKLTFKVA